MSPWRIVAVAALLCAASGACHAARRMSCSTGSFVQLTPAPARIVVPADAVPGTVLWSGSASLSFSCTSNARGARLGGGKAIGGSAQKSMVSSSASVDGLAVASAGTPSLVLSTPGCSLRSLSEHNRQWSFGLISTSAGTCAGSFVAPVVFVRDTNALGPDIAATNPEGGSGVDWIVFPVQGGGGTVSVGLPTAVPLVAGGGCTVAPVAMTVTLPVVSVATLGAPGRSAGATAFRFPLQTCQAVPTTAYAVYASWSFSAVSGYPSVIANTAPGAAANVGVQLLDASGVPVTSGPATSTLAGNVDTAGGVLAQTYIARYFATGVVSPGAVSATATYTLTYQ